MQLVRRFRPDALFCALAVLCCELISRPYASMGVCDDEPYILMAQHLARTGHIAYNSRDSATLCWCGPFLLLTFRIASLAAQIPWGDRFHPPPWADQIGIARLSEGLERIG